MYPWSHELYPWSHDMYPWSHDMYPWSHDLYPCLLQYKLPKRQSTEWEHEIPSRLSVCMVHTSWGRFPLRVWEWDYDVIC